MQHRPHNGAQSFRTTRVPNRMMIEVSTNEAGTAELYDAPKTVAAASYATMFMLK